jgi:hypothetical protein
VLVGDHCLVVRGAVMETRQPEWRRDFTCVVCQRNIEMRWNHLGRNQILPPLCAICESRYSEGIGRPAHGAFRDRREAIRIYALAEALHCEAAQKKWKSVNVAA